MVSCLCVCVVPSSVSLFVVVLSLRFVYTFACLKNPFGEAFLFGCLPSARRHDPAFLPWSCLRSRLFGRFIKYAEARF